MIKKSLLLITLLSLSNLASAHPEALQSSNAVAQIIHLLTSPFHIVTFIGVFVILAIVTYKMSAKPKS